MFKLRHGSRDINPYLRSIKIGYAGVDVSFSDEAKAMTFISKAVAIHVGTMLRHAYGNFYPIEVTE